MKDFKTVTVLGANGTMGANSAAIVAAFGGAKVYMLARTLDKAKEGVQTAVASVRSGVFADNLIPGTYDDDLEKAVSESDWVFELVAESYEVKEPLMKRISAARKPGTLVSTVSSGLSIERLASHLDEDGQKYYYGTHFFNPPYKLVLCELIVHPKNDPAYTKELSDYLENKLHRHVIIANDRPGFAGNRIGFQFMNEAAIYAEKLADKGGIHLVDQLLSGYTGRAMAPLATADLVGLDVHKAIVDNIYENTKDAAHDTFKMPDYLQKLIDQGALGNKKGKGLYMREKTPEGKSVKKVYNIKTGNYEDLPKLDLSFKKKAASLIHESQYFHFADFLKNEKGEEAELVRRFIARYISYSYSLIPDVTDQDGVDGAMGFGFNWVPPSAWVDLLGGVDETKKFIDAAGIPVPDYLGKISGSPVYKLQSKLDYRQLFRGS
ncbi:MAG: 3-hydroxyacyl-CoA dehydrogenase [Leptospiraceae bacterium]|nr:3-hydroxyacyl-CoA dehydrogenase [Leptospiraceae bacterium]